MKGKVYIYALKDPIHNSIRYIGQTTRPAFRLTNHLSDKSGSKKCIWISSLKADGLLPILDILEECSRAEANAREIFHIQSWRDAGHLLLNKTPGGGVSPLKDGKVNISATIEEELRDRLNVVQEKQIRSFSNAVEYALMRGLSVVESEIQQSEEQSKTEK